MTRSRQPRRAILGATLAAVLGGIAVPTTAVGGPTHVLDHQHGVIANRLVDAQCAESPGGSTFIVTCQASLLAQNGPLWSAYLRTPVPGSIIEGLSWDIARGDHPTTNVAIEVVDELGRVVHSTGEAGIPVLPAPLQSFQIGVAGSQVQLRLSQVGSQSVPARAYTITNPRLTVRDVTAPSGLITFLTPEWIRAGSAAIAWRVEDNFGNDGVGFQRIAVGRRTLYVGMPGVGQHTAALNVSELPDGQHLLGLSVSGNGTSPAKPSFQFLRIDRTAPVLSVKATRIGPNRARVSIESSDGASGPASWVVRASSPGGRVVAGGNDGGGQTVVDLRPLVPRGGELRFFAEALDHAGNLASAISESVRRDGPPDGRPAYPLGPPERLLEQDAAALTDFADVSTPGLRTPQAAAYRRGRGALRIPQVRARHGAGIRLSAVFRAGRRPLAGAAVYLVDPHGRAQARKLTGRNGRVAFSIRAHSPGVWRAVALGRPLVAAPLRLAVTPRVSARIGTRFLRPGQTLTVRGQVRPADAGALKQVQLQALLRGRWRPLVQARANRRGLYTLRYRFVATQGSYEVPMRVIVPRERGWPYAPVIARRFTVAVSS